MQTHASDLEPTDDGYWLQVHGKGNRPRRVPVPDALAAEAVAWLAANGDGFMFPGDENGHLDAQTLGNVLADLVPPGVSMHKLRHRFASRAYGVDRNLFALQRILGHTSPVTT